MKLLPLIFGAVFLVVLMSAGCTSTSYEFAGVAGTYTFNYDHSTVIEIQPNGYMKVLSSSDNKIKNYIGAGDVPLEWIDKDHFCIKGFKEPCFAYKDGVWYLYSYTDGYTGIYLKKLD